MLSDFENATVSHAGLKPDAKGPSSHLLVKERFDAAMNVISAWEGYQVTPLFELEKLAGEIGIANVLYKHEGPRFGLGSFKALGGAYAVMCLVQRVLEAQSGSSVSLADIQDGKYADAVKDITIISATDGNHGRSVAWGAARCGARCRIYIHAEVSEFRAEALRELGAEVVRVDGDYDASVAETRKDADEHGWLIVSDTSWPGYVDPPRDVLSGYGVMAREIVASVQTPPTHVFLQGGVGGLAAAVAAVFDQEWGKDAPRVVIVEPELAACLFESAKAGKATSVQIEEETIMAGLSCGEPSEIAWDVLAGTASDFLTIPESIVPPAVRILAKGQFGDPVIEAGESAVAGLCGLMAAALQPGLREKLGLNENSVAVMIGSEGVTDPDIFASIMKGEI